MTRDGRKHRITTLREAIASYLEISGLGRQNQQDRVTRAWCEVLGVETAAYTRVSRTIRRGVLVVEVNSPALLSELSGFRKEELLTGLRERIRSPYIEDIRFKLGANF